SGAALLHCHICQEVFQRLSHRGKDSRSLEPFGGVNRHILFSPPFDCPAGIGRIVPEFVDKHNVAVETGTKRTALSRERITVASVNASTVPSWRGPTVLL